MIYFVCRFRKESDQSEGFIPSLFTEEEVVRFRELPAVLNELEQVVELAVDVAADDDRRAHRLHVALLEEVLLDLLADLAQVSFRKRLTLLEGFKALVDIHC